jgi:hypothetical protein
MGRYLRAATFLFPILTFARPALAQFFEGARLISLAETQRALSTGNDSIYVNPGGLALGSMYSVELGYLDDIRGSDRRLNASIVDSQAGPVAGGLAYTYSTRRPDQFPDHPDARLKGHRIEIAAATKLGNQVGIGVTTRYLHYDLKNGPMDEEGFKTLTFDAGVAWRVIEGLSIGAVGYNLTNSKRPEVPIAIGGGIGYEVAGFSIEVDTRYTFVTEAARVSFAAGYVIADLVPLRLGAWHDFATDAWAVSGGVGFNYERIGVDIGYRQLVSGEANFEDGDERILGVALRGRFF